MTKKMWGGRFDQATDALVEAYTASIHFDLLLAADDIQGSMAHAAMLAQCNLLSDAEHQQIKQGLQILEKQYADGSAQISIADEDIHMNIERALQSLIGEPAKKLHTARSRNDQVALDLHLYLRKAVVTIISLLQNLQATFLDLATQHAELIMPGYTHLQRAQPIYFATHCLAYFSMFARDIARLQDLWKRINISPLGACALAGSSLATDPHFTAQLLGFDDVYSNTLDAVSDRDFVIEFSSAAALIMLHISRLSEELILWASQEFYFITFDDAFSTGSSMMPQKKNPDVAELARGKTGRVYGALMNLLTMQKGLPLTYNKDMQEDKEPLFDTVKTVTDTLRVFSPMLACIKLNTQNMRNAVDDGFLNATALAEYLVQRDLPFRHAHAVVGKLVSHCIKHSCRLEALSLETLQQFSPVIDNAVYAALDITHIVQAHDQNNHKQKALQSAQHSLLATQNWIDDKYALFEKVEGNLKMSVMPG